MTFVRSLIQSHTGFLLSVIIVLSCSWSPAASFTVTTSADSGAGSLRQAVIDANAASGDDTIDFDIPAGQCEASGVCVINLASSLPLVTESVIVDGRSQPRFGSAPVNVCATASSPSYLRVQITAPGDYIFDVETLSLIDSFGFFGLAFSGTINTDAIRYHTYSEGRIQCNHFGTDGTGTVPLDLASGVCLSCSGNGGGSLTVGTDGDGIDDVAERNVFAAGGRGVNFNAGNSLYPTWVAGNYFGVGADGTTPMNLANGIYLRQSTAQTLIGSNLDGMSDALESNIFGHCMYGVSINTWAGSEYSNFVVGNQIGRDARGRIAGNDIGIAVSGSSTDQEISHNQIEASWHGVEIRSDATLAGSSGTNCIVNNSVGADHAGAAVGVSLENNYWGAADGPSGVGPGSGDSIDVTGSGSVGFTPWLTSPRDVCVFIFIDGFDNGDVDAWDSAVGGP